MTADETADGAADAAEAAPVEARHIAYADFAARHPRWFRNEKGGVTVVTDAAGMARIERVMAETYAGRGLPREWAEVGIAYEDPYIMLVRDAVIFPDGAPGVHHRVLRPGTEPSGVAILPLYRGQIVLVRHFRHATRSWHWEVPRGATDPGEPVEVAAARELAEEIGARVTRVRDLGRIHGSTALMGMSVVLTIADIDALGETQVGEGIAGTRLVDQTTLDAMVRNGDITDAFTLGCILHAKLAGEI